MTDQPLIVLSDPPAAVVAGSGQEYGSVSMDRAVMAHDLATRAYKRLSDPGVAPDDVASLRQAVSELSDAVSLLSGEIMQIAEGIAMRRIAAEPRE